MAEEKNKTLKKAKFEMDYLTGDEEVRRIAELHEKWEMDYISGMNYAKRQGLEEGKKKEKKNLNSKQLKK